MEPQKLVGTDPLVFFWGFPASKSPSRFRAHLATQGLAKTCQNYPTSLKELQSCGNRGTGKNKFLPGLVMLVKQTRHMTQLLSTGDYKLGLIHHFDPFCGSCPRIYLDPGVTRVMH